MSDLQNRMKISPSRIDAINEVILNPDSQIMQDFLKVVEKYGTPEEINAKAEEAGKLENLLQRVSDETPEYRKDLDWLIEQKDNNAFISVDEYRKKILGDKFSSTKFDDDMAVTLETSALQYFPWVRKAAEVAIAEKKLIPGRFIRVRQMKEQEQDGDLPADRKSVV